MDKILKTLVEIPSVSEDPLAINPAIEFIDRFLSERGMHVIRYESNGVENIVATTQKTKTPKILLAAHVDVVPASLDKFVFLNKDGRFYGRGVFDMKFAIAAYLQLVDDLNGSLTDYDFGIMITSDEESGGHNGTEYLINRGYKPDLVVLPDAGDTPNGWKVESSAKGAVWGEVRVSGISAHGSRPWVGDNAIDKLIAIIEEIRLLFKDQGPATNTMNVSTFHSGNSYNQIPDEASAFLDIRVINSEEKSKIVERISEICKKYGSEFDSTLNWESVHCDFDNPLVKSFIKNIRKVTGSEPNKLTSTGGSDSRYFFVAGVPYIVASPPGDGYHSDNEWVSKEGIYQLRDVLRSFLDQEAKTIGAETFEKSSPQSEKTPQFA